MRQAGRARLTLLSVLLVTGFCFADSNLPKVRPDQNAYMSGVRSLNSGDFVGAESRFQEALTSGSKDVRLLSLFGLINVELRKGQPQEAEKYLRQAQAAAPDH